MRTFLLKYRYPIIAVLLFIGMALTLRLEGRVWVCACGSLFPWAGNIWSQHNSQHLFDPYAFTHFLHGLVFAGVLVLLLPRSAPSLRLMLALFCEGLWEVLENSPMIINRYREATFAQGYEGDSILNSSGDLLACLAGVLFAQRFGWRKALPVFVLVELLLLVWIRDNLTLNVIMLVHPIDFIRVWQTGG